MRLEGEFGMVRVGRVKVCVCGWLGDGRVCVCECLCGCGGRMSVYVRKKCGRKDKVVQKGGWKCGRRG